MPQNEFEIHVCNVCTWTGADADGDEGEQGVCASQAFIFYPSCFFCCFSPLNIHHVITELIVYLPIDIWASCSYLSPLHSFSTHIGAGSHCLGLIYQLHIHFWCSSFSVIYFWSPFFPIQLVFKLRIIVYIKLQIFLFWQIHLPPFLPVTLFFFSLSWPPSLSCLSDMNGHSNKRQRQPALLGHHPTEYGKAPGGHPTHSLTKRGVIVLV